MKIGILSESHGKAKRLKAALELLADRQVEAIVHCGDVGSPQCVRLLASAGVDAYMVLGNMDRHGEKLRAAAAACGVHFAWEVVTVPIGGGRRLAATHGHDEAVLRELIHEQQFPYVCHGHSHSARDERTGHCRVINPGALLHPRDPHYPTVAVLDTAADTVEHVQVK